MYIPENSIGIYNTLGKRFKVYKGFEKADLTVTFTYIEIGEDDMPCGGLSGRFSLPFEKSKYDSSIFEKLMEVIGR